MTCARAKWGAKHDHARLLGFCNLLNHDFFRFLFVAVNLLSTTQPKYALARPAYGPQVRIQRRCQLRG